MSEKYFKYIQWLLYVLMGLSALLTIVFYVSSGSPDLLLYWMYFLLIFSGLVLLITSTYGILKNPKGSYKALLVVGVMLVLGILSYALSKNTFSPAMLEKYDISPNGVRWVGAGLLMTYFIMIIAIGSFIYSSVYRLIK
jgi:hypothetical protein